MKINPTDMNLDINDRKVQIRCRQVNFVLYACHTCKTWIAIFVTEYLNTSLKAFTKFWQLLHWRYLP